MGEAELAHLNEYLIQFVATTARHLLPGDVAFHHSHTVHYSSANQTAHSRRQIGIGYNSSRAKRDETAFAAHQKEVAALHADKLPAPGSAHSRGSV